ncbi:hypothetical protein [Marinobacter psychrophilus]|uniref:hypothetical protein n=1 Tax=Marinobacter psychrophilus TaxID=330734 RepID=UPI001D0CE9F6|nr:hypothetical protein [Marinobacter psychrophilus]
MFLVWTLEKMVQTEHEAEAFAVFYRLGSLGKYLQPFDNLMFFSAWPMPPARPALFLLREYDTLTLSRQLVPATD